MSITGQERRASVRDQYNAIVAAPFVIRYLNVDAINADRFTSEAEAITAGKRIGFEFTVHEQHPVKGSRLCGSWEVFRGWRAYRGSFHV